ncbi:hypothetical protein COU59_01885 [Candidatus Pacearchaeota archaeon CG10_big_fil_rev_8_21_14_0_10_34_12]|nr:MAG: hypothetical protein COU59_01885 [Candidatus Pacearchaeota archaeon CG10_big_fil_rev_8_21_14_0_10_34_12]
MTNNKIRKPNFFIVGVARAGTSSWHNYLKQHPEVFMSEEQRPNFFGEHIDPNAEYYITEERYLSLFKKVKNENIIGESSHLFGSTIAPNQIKKFNPYSKVLIILRSPIEVLRSNIDYDGYKKVWSLIFTLKELLYYENLKRWIDVFGKKNVHIIIFDDFEKDVKREYKKVCDFLGIDNTFVPKFERLNFAAKTNYPFFMKIAFFIWNKLPFIARLKAKEFIGSKKKEKIQKNYRKMDNHNEVKTSIIPKDKRELQKAFFLKEIEQTEKLLKRNLDSWKR